MKPAMIIPREIAAKKPPHGQPCTRCGLCCMATLCPLGAHVFGRQQGPCPALTLDDAGLSSCGLVSAPARHSPVRTFAVGAREMSEAALVLIGSATGCDARINGEPINHGFYETLLAWDRRMRKQVARAKRLWGIG